MNSRNPARRLACLFVWLVSALGLRAQSAGPATPSSAALLKNGVALAKAGRYLESAEALKPYTDTTPDNVSAQCLLVLVEFRAQQTKEALEGFRKLESGRTTADSTACIRKLTPVLRPGLNQELEKALDARLSELKPEEALSLVDRMYLEPHQRELLKFYVDRRQGNLASALSRLITIHTMNAEAPLENLQKD